MNQLKSHTTFIHLLLKIRTFKEKTLFLVNKIQKMYSDWLVRFKQTSIVNKVFEKIAATISIVDFRMFWKLIKTKSTYEVSWFQQNVQCVKNDRLRKVLFTDLMILYVDLTKIWTRFLEVEMRVLKKARISDRSNAKSNLCSFRVTSDFSETVHHFYQSW